MKRFIIHTNIYEYLNENTSDKIFIINKNKFKLFIGDVLVSESGFNVEQPDEWFDEKYVTLYNLKTIEKFKREGFAKYLLDQIFNYVKNELKLNIITLLVYKNNYKAVNLYFKCGFKIYIDYDDIDDPCFTLIYHL